MHLRRSARDLVAVVVAGATLLAGCSSDEPTPEEVAASEATERRFEACVQLGDDVAAALQQFVDQFAVSADGVPAGPSTGGLSVEGLQQAIDGFARRRVSIGCSAREFQVVLNRVLGDVEGEGPYARAVAARLRQEVVDMGGPRVTVTVAPGEDLADAVHGASADALVRLEPGTHVLDEPLVLLRGTHIVGAGSEETVIQSSAPDAVVVHGGGGPLRLEGVTLVHAGTAPASVLLVTAGGHDLRDVTVRGGVADDGSETGWGLVLVGGMEPGGAPREVVQLTARDNEAGGIVIAGAWAPRLEDVTSIGNGRCGICWLELAGGSLDGGTVSRNELGLSITGAAAPTVSGVRVTGNAAVGVLVEDGAGPTLRSLDVDDNGSVGVAVRGEAAPDLAGVVVTGHDEAGLAVEDTAGPTVTDLTVGGTTIGVFVRGDADVDLSGLRVSGVVDAHVVLGGRSGGRVVDVTCDDDPFGIVLLEDTTVEVGDVECEVVDDR